MRHPMLLLLLAPLGLAGCGQVSMQDDPISTSGSSPTPPPTAAPVPVAAVTTPPPPPVPAGAMTTVTRPRSTTITTARPATTRTTRPLSRAEATSRLCTALEEADERIQRGNFLGGGLRLSGGIAANGKAADPPVVAAARAMLRAGVNGDPEAYVDARPLASAACAQAGYPIQLRGPVQCVTTPCP